MSHRRLVRQHACLLHTTAIRRPSLLVRVLVYNTSPYTAATAGVQINVGVDALPASQNPSKVAGKKPSKPRSDQTEFDTNGLVALNNPSASNKSDIRTLKVSAKRPKDVPPIEAAIAKSSAVENNRTKALKGSGQSGEPAKESHRHNRLALPAIRKIKAQTKGVKAGGLSVPGSLPAGEAINGEIGDSKTNKGPDKQAQSANAPPSSLDTPSEMLPPGSTSRLGRSESSERAKAMMLHVSRRRSPSGGPVRFIYPVARVRRVFAARKSIKTAGKRKQNEKEVLLKTGKNLPSTGSVSAAGGGKKIAGKKKTNAVRQEQVEQTQPEVEAIESSDLKLVPINIPQPLVPGLAYGLERVLFNPGVYHLQDPRSRVFNFDPYLQTIMPVKEFDFGALKEYITSSRDETLTSMAEAEGKKYTGSTSSMTSALAHFHFLLSRWRLVDTSNLSQGFPEDTRSFTLVQRAPSAIFLRWKDGTYAVDADKEFETSNILLMLGQSMEKLLTMPTNEFEKLRKQNSEQVNDEERNEPQSYHYTTMGDFLMRSQLDAYHPNVPGTGMFDLKTRAVVSIRMDAENYQSGTGYEIRGRFGQFESYEREYYDMIRSAFLKYSLQVRMGRMDGIFVAFHNIERIFGFQYISLHEMDLALHGQEDLTVGDSEFKLSLDLLNRVFDRATARFPKQSLRLFFETREAKKEPFMYIFAEPIEEQQIQAIQESKKAEIEEYERTVLGLDRTSSGAKNDKKEGLTVDDAGDVAREAQIQSSGNLQDLAESGSITMGKEMDSNTVEDRQPEVLAMILKIKNNVNGRHVLRPIGIGPEDRWSIEYSLAEVKTQDQSRRLYKATHRRRAEALSGDHARVSSAFRTSYLKKLRQLSTEGRTWREEQTKKHHSSPVEVLRGQS